MEKRWSWLVGLVLVPFFAGAASAQEIKSDRWWSQACSQFRLHQQRNNALPQPFARRDQGIVKETFGVMFAKGATINRILDSVHFDPETQQLNNVGKTRLREILAQKKNLDVLISTTFDGQLDLKRKKQIQALLATLKFPGNRPGVSTTFHLPHHSVGAEKAALRQTFWASQPEPSLGSVAGDISGSAK